MACRGHNLSVLSDSIWKLQNKILVNLRSFLIISTYHSGDKSSVFNSRLDFNCLLFDLNQALHNKILNKSWVLRSLNKLS